MKFHKKLFLLILISSLLLGCEKKSGIEGKVVDGKEQPIAGVKVVAMQVQPIKGYEQFETKTHPDGKFSFKGVYPASEYIIKVEGALKERILSGPEGQISLLTSPIVQRFVITKNGVVIDSKSGLYWAQDAGQQRATWFEANEYTHNLKLGGYSDWRLPSKEELESLTGKALSTTPSGSEDKLKQIDELSNDVPIDIQQPYVYKLLDKTTGRVHITNNLEKVNLVRGNSNFNIWKTPFANQKLIYKMYEESANKALPDGINEKLNEMGFKNVQSHFFWWSYPKNGVTVSGWLFKVWYGNEDYNLKGINFYVWPVRSRQ